MKKKRVAKILAGAAVAALCVTGAVNYGAFHAADIVGTAEIGTYTAGMNEKEWEAANDSLTAAGEAVKQAAEESAAEKAAAAESAQEAETAQTAQKPNQTAQKNRPTTQTAKNTQQAAIQEPAPAPAETPAATPTAQPVQNEQSAENAPAQPAAPAPEAQYCGVCHAVFYSESEVLAHINTVHVTPAQQPEPAPAPRPQTTAYVCGYCGAKFYNESESSAHLRTHTTPPADVYTCTCGFKGTLAEVDAHQEAMDNAGMTAGYEGYGYAGY